MKGKPTKVTNKTMPKKDIPSAYDMRTGVDVGKGKKHILTKKKPC